MRLLPLPKEPPPPHEKAPNSMNFLAPDNVRCMAKGSRGVFASTSSASAETCTTIAVALTGLVTAVVVWVLRLLITTIEEWKLRSVEQARLQSGVGAAWLTFVGTSVALVLCGYVCTSLEPHAAGSGLPQMIAYLNGVKLRGFTSSKVLLAKLLGTACAVAAGLFCGPEGPIIHMGGCVGKQLLRALYYMSCLPPRRVFKVFEHVCLCGRLTGPDLPCCSAPRCPASVQMRNDLDQRDFVAIGAGAGVAAAFLAPISGTLFVVEEASSHFSLSLLWRAFSAAMAAVYSTRVLQLLSGQKGQLVAFEQVSPLP